MSYYPELGSQTVDKVKVVLQLSKSNNVTKNN